MIKIRSFRPFPAAEIAEALKNVKAFAAMDKDDSHAGCSPPARPGRPGRRCS